MSSAAPDYKALYKNALLENLSSQRHEEAVLEEAEKARQQAQAHIAELTEELTLSLLELDRLRRKLFGRSADNRSRYTDPNQITLFDLSVSEEERQESDQQVRKEFSPS